jgi:ABC-type transport system involved in multi-copper enzyme maturation permease subunit
MSGYGFATVGRMEWIKVRSVRSTWWLLAGSVLAMAATGVGVGIGYRGHTPVATSAQIVNNSLGGAVLAQLLIGAFGIITVTNEYSAGMIHATFAAIPRRRLVLAAKAVVGGVAMFVVGLAGSLVGFGAGQAAIRGTAIPPASLGDPAILRTVLLTGVYLGVVGLVGLGLGTIVRHTGGAIGALFAGLFVSMVVAGMFGPGGMPASRFVPMMMLVNSIAVTTPVPGMLSPWAGIAVMVGYAALAMGAGAVLLVRRDA